jgi:ferredoxin
MIIGEQKSKDEIANMIANYEKILIVGCNTCVAICQAGGEKEVGILATALRMKSKLDGKNQIIDEASVERQCEFEFVEKLEDKIKEYDAILSLACGVGPQTIIEVFPEAVVLPGLNTTFLGLPEEQGLWEERCGGCGNCVLDKTGGICPIVRCSKSMLNGPCGGSQEGKCEVNVEIPCGWQLIYDRLKALGKLEIMDEIEPPKDWNTGRHGGPRKMVREDLTVDNEPEGQEGEK